MSVDLAICTKDRDNIIADCISRYKNKIDCSNIIVVNSTANPDKELLTQIEGVTWVFTPDAKLGYARNVALKHCKSDYVVMLDDDLLVSDEWQRQLLPAFEDNDVVAVSSKVIYGEGFIAQLFLSGLRERGGSGGCAIYNREAIVGLGGFNDNIHRGEDIELELRVERAGKKWPRRQDVLAFHPVTLKEFLGRPKANVCGWNFIMRYSRSKLRFIARRFASIWVMPVYYFWRTLDLRVLGCYFIYKLLSMLYWLSGRYDV